MVGVLDLTRTVLAHEYVHYRPRTRADSFSFGRLCIWREPPLTWLQESLGSIVPFNCSSRSKEGRLVPESILSIRPENLPGSDTSPRGGIIFLEWNAKGTLLASQNGLSSLLLFSAFCFQNNRLTSLFFFSFLFVLFPFGLDGPYRLYANDSVHPRDG